MLLVWLRPGPVVSTTRVISLIATLRVVVVATGYVTGTSVSLLLTSLHELKAFSVLHGRSILSKFKVRQMSRHCGTYLDRLDVLLVVQGHVSWVQVEEVADLVRHIGPDLIVSPITQPNLKESLFGSQGDRGSDDLWLVKLLTYSQNKKLLVRKVNYTFGLAENLPIMANRMDSHILSILSSFLILRMTIPPSGESCTAQSVD